MIEVSPKMGHYTPMSKRLFDAIRESRLVQVKLLVFKNQLNINTKNQQGENSLIEALRISDDRKRGVTFSFLLKCGIEVHNRDLTRRDAMEWAAKLNREKQALQLLNGPMLEYDFLHKDCDGLTFLHYATINNMKQVVKVVVKRLTRYYISVDIHDSFGMTPYLHAKRLKHEHIASILVEAGASTHILANDDEKLGVTKQDDSIDKIVQLKINGRLPQLQRFLASKSTDKLNTDTSTPQSYRTRNSHSIITNEINSLMQLKQDGDACEKYVHSTSIGDMDDSMHTATGIEPSRSSHVSTSTSLVDLNDIFDIVSDQMTQSYCRPAQRPKPKQIIFHKTKPVKRSTLAAIMRKPVTDRPTLQSKDRRRSNIKKSAKNETPTRHLVPTITTSYID